MPTDQTSDAGYIEFDKGPVYAEELEKGQVISTNEDIADRDIAAEYATQGRLEITPELDRRLRRKADVYICTMLIVIYAVQYMDKVSSSSATVLSLREDLGMHGNMYSWVGSSFYLGYIAFELPMVSLLQKLPLAKVTGAIIIIWGIVMGASAAVHSYAPFIVCRTLLGAFEGAITPACMILTGQWYKRSEQYARLLIWFGAGNGLGGILCNLIAYCLAKRVENADPAPYDAWRILFLILGCITVFLGVIFVLHIPDNPSKAWFLNEEERRGQVERIRENLQGYGNRKIKWPQVREAFLDVRTYLVFVVVVLCQVPNGGITNFNALLISGMGYTDTDTLLMSMPNGAVQLVTNSLVGVLTMYFWNKRRMYYAISCSLGAVLGTAFLAFGVNNAMRLSGMYIWSMMAPIFYVAMLSTLVTNSAGHTKKSLCSGLVMIGYCVGNVIGPQTFKSEEAPTYHTATATMVACYVVDTFLLLVLVYINRRANRLRDLRDEKLPGDIKNPEFADLTDKTNPEFRYAL